MPAGAGTRRADRIADLTVSLLEARGALDIVVVDEITDVVRHAVESAVDRQPPPERRRLRQREQHLVCGLLAAAVEALAPLASADTTIAAALADAVLPPSTDMTEALSRALLKEMVRQIIDAAGQTALTKVQAVLKVMRICAVAACPDPERHASVRRQCLAPLAGELGAEAITSLLHRP